MGGCGNFISKELPSLSIKTERKKTQNLFQFVFINSKISSFNQQILDHSEKNLLLNETFHFQGDFFSSKLQEIELEFQEISRSMAYKIWEC